MVEQREDKDMERGMGGMQSDAPMICEKCGATFKTQQELDEHIAEKHAA